MGSITADVNISLEPHLLESLKLVRPFLSPELAHQLENYISNTPPPLIPYSTIFTISQWTRSDRGQEILRANGLDPNLYSMISLLAGTTTSPERKFGDYAPPKDPEQIALDRIQERKKITILLNALLSIGGVGFAAWWAGDKTGWQMEWRALFALFSAFLVAIAEAGLYLIWASRQTKPKNSETKKRFARYKKIDPVSETSDDPNDAPTVIVDSLDDKTNVLRHRK